MGIRRALAVALLLGLIAAAPAAAFTPPVLYVRQTLENSTDHTPKGDWVPLASAPTLNWLGGYEIGYAFEDSPATGASQHAALEVTAVPDGQPTQPRATPYCGGGPGTVGTIVPAGAALQFEGLGTYTVRVSVGPSTGNSTACLGGANGSASTTGSFTVSAGSIPAVVGHPLSIRTTPLKRGAFSGIRAPAPPGGDAELHCARNATVKPDGSITGSLMQPEPGLGGLYGQIAEADLKLPGVWTCVARGSVKGLTASFGDVAFTTPWSPPLRVEVQSDFLRSRSVLRGGRTRHPKATVTAQFGAIAAGGVGTIKMRRLLRCSGKRMVTAPAGTFKARFNAKGKATFTLKQEPNAYFYLGTLTFSGTRFYARSVDPNPIFLEVDNEQQGLEFVSGLQFPYCPGYRHGR